MLSTIIINSYTDAWLSKCVRSVNDSDEIVIINDGLRSQSQFHHVYSLILNPFPLGIAWCKAIGKKVARGDQMLCIRGSDLINPNFIEICKNVDFEGIVYGDYMSADKKEIITPEEVSFESVLNGYVPSTYCFPRATEIEFGRKEPYEDIEFWLHALEMGIPFQKVKMISYYDRLGLEEVDAVYDERLRILRERYL